MQKYNKTFKQTVKLFEEFTEGKTCVTILYWTDYVHINITLNPLIFCILTDGTMIFENNNEDGFQIHITQIKEINIDEFGQQITITLMDDTNVLIDWE